MLLTCHGRVTGQGQPPIKLMSVLIPVRYLLLISSVFSFLALLLEREARIKSLYVERSACEICPSRASFSFLPVFLNWIHVKEGVSAHYGGMVRKTVSIARCSPHL